MRRTIVHGLRNVDNDVLWDVITHKLAPLVTELNRLIEAKYGAQDG